MPVKILVADDHEIVRRGVRQILSCRPEWEVCAEAANGAEALAAVERLKPDVTILDLTMPVMSGLDAAREIARRNLPTRVLIFTMHYSKDLLRLFRDGGVRGYVLKVQAAQELINAVETLLRGNTFFHSEEGEAEEQQPATLGRKPLLLRQILETTWSLILRFIGPRTAKALRGDRSHLFRFRRVQLVDRGLEQLFVPL
jgi:DNA-binding NarL/FixJ family response regulator